MKKLLIAAAVVTAATMTMGGCSVMSGQSTVGDYVDDATVTTRVKARFAEDPKVSAMRISVETMKGEVQLSGFAATAAEKAHAAEIASKVSGVKRVRNDIVIKPAN